jgi:antitoxin component YwqK of YwqJK toxin-antitoxin module
MNLLPSAALFAAFSLSYGSLIAQEPPRPRDYGTHVLTEVANMDRQKQAADILGKLATVPPADSVYERVILERLIVDMGRDSISAALAHSDEGIREQGKMEWLFHYERAICLARLKRFDEAEAYVDSCALRYPGNASFATLKTLVATERGDHQRAVTYAKEAVARFPAHAEAHAALGQMARAEGHIAQAAMCFSMALCLHRGGASDTHNLNTLDQMLNGTLENQPIGVDLGKADDFSEIDLLLRNKVAMAKAYGVKPDLSYAACRQTHLLFTWLTKHSSGTGFWSEFYVPIFKEMMDQNLFEGFIYNALMSADNEPVRAIGQKNRSKVDAFEVKFNPIFMDHVQTYPEPNGGPAVQHWYGNDGRIRSFGAGNLAGDRISGPWTYFHKNGLPSSQGVLDANGKRTGAWTDFHENGRKKSTVVYDGGVEDGLYLSYHPNGVMNDSLSLIKGVPIGAYARRDATGTLLMRKQFTEGKATGPAVTMFSCNAVKDSYSMVNNLAEGSVSSFYPDGAKQFEGVYAKGQRNGRQFFYYHNGNKESEDTYLAGTLDGPFKKWWPDGTLKESGNRTQGKLSGPDSTWDANGNLASCGQYDNKGRTIGTHRSYDDGHLYMELEYTNDLLVNYKYLDRKGQVLGEGHRKQGKFQFEEIDPQGKLRSKGTYLDEGSKDGTWTHYAEDGTVTRTQEFDKGKLKGIDRTFFLNGKPKEEGTCSDGERTGPFTEYFINGKPRFIGWSVNGQLDGSYRHYLPDGTLIEDEYYVNGDRDGWQRYFDHSGRLSSMVRVSNGIEAEKFRYGADGRLLQHWTMPSGYFLLEEVLPSGARLNRIEVINGVFHGKATWFYPDGSVQCEGRFLNGKRDGQWTWYRPDGGKDSELAYAYGDLVGIERNWYVSGELYNERYYTNGQLNGSSKTWWPNGTLRSEVPMRNGMAQGTLKNYASNGDLQLVRFYDQDRLTGYACPKPGGGLGDTVQVGTGVVEVKGTYADGKPSRTMRYRNGELDGAYLTYHPNGKVEEQEEYEVGKSLGEDKETWPDGNPRLVRTYDNGILHGSYKVYARNGVVLDERTYRYGDMDGERLIRNSQGKLLATLTYVDGVAVSLKR